MQKCETTNQTKSSQTSFQKMHRSALTALTDQPQIVKLAKPMCPSSQTLPPAFHKHLWSTCSCQHCPSPGELRESWVSSPEVGAHGPGCQGPRKERGWQGSWGLHTCPSRAPFTDIYTLALSLENSQTQEKALTWVIWSDLWWQGLPLLNREPLESAVCNEVIVCDGFHNNTGGGRGGDGRRGAGHNSVKLTDSLHSPLYCHILRDSIINNKKLKREQKHSLGPSSTHRGHPRTGKGCSHSIALA